MRSLLLTSQLPVANWPARIGDPALADSILDRPVHNAHRLNLKGESRRFLVRMPSEVVLAAKRCLISPATGPG